MPPPPPPPRSISISGGDDDYVSGNIMEIELCNFMTNDRLVNRPGPRLNLVVGPNGSGKSSLVCAIALALATDPSILGRASSVRAFVKRGEESDHVRLSVRSQSQASDIHITRKVDTNNKCTSVPKKDIIDVIKKFNIQINNLTQFLPQDRVCEFAKLTPIQLLEKNEKAVGDPNLPVQHRQLIERSRELRNIEVVAVLWGARVAWCTTPTVEDTAAQPRRSVCSPSSSTPT
ncbi:structural maintenance of chromosomes protein 5 isoform x3 [Hordeum vulgare]|nr:structural maintenance of chromosomes protein 5 isoform x3 [Hordeum vulgare]